MDISKSTNYFSKKNITKVVSREDALEILDNIHKYLSSEETKALTLDDVEDGRGFILVGKLGVYAWELDDKYSIEFCKEDMGKTTSLVWKCSKLPEKLVEIFDAIDEIDKVDQQRQFDFVMTTFKKLSV